MAQCKVLVKQLIHGRVRQAGEIVIGFLRIVRHLDLFSRNVALNGRLRRLRQVRQLRIRITVKERLFARLRLTQLRNQNDFALQLAFPLLFIMLESFPVFGNVEYAFRAERGQHRFAGLHAFCALAPGERHGYQVRVTRGRHFQRKAFERPASAERSPPFLMDIGNTALFQLRQRPVCRSFELRRAGQARPVHIG